MLIILTSSELFLKNSSWQAKQPIPYTPVMFYSDCVKMGEDLAQNFGYKIIGGCITATHRPTHPFSPENVGPKAIRFSPPTYCTFLFPRLKINRKAVILTALGIIAGGAEDPHRNRLSGCI
jgi:hypothetical protein